jgi:hypothetical protein
MSAVDRKPRKRMEMMAKLRKNHAGTRGHGGCKTELRREFELAPASRRWIAHRI